MEIKQLKIFLTLARLRNFTKTAEELHYAQSNISSHIQNLEEELQVQLFHRIGHNVSLTESGKQLVPYATQILSLQEEAIHNISTIGIRKIVIGASESLCSYLLPAKIQTFKQFYPHIEIEIVILDTDNYLSLFEQGSINIAYILDTKIDNSNLVCLSSAQEPITLFSAPTHPLASKKKIQLSDMEHENLIVTGKRCCYRKALEAEFRMEETTFHPILETSSIQIIKNFVTHNLGIGFLPLLAIQEEIAQKLLTPLAYHTDYHILSQLLIHKDAWISNELQTLIDLLMK